MAFQEAATDFRRFIVENVERSGRTLGTGSYGSVEEVVANGLVCAGKLLHPALLDMGNHGVQRVAQRYLQECALMAELRHPNLVLFLGVCFFPESPTPMLLMEKMDVTLDHVLETRPNIPLSMKRSILTDVSRGLQYLHNHNPPLIHRDITARNVMLVEASMLAKISDFGNSRIINVRALREFTQAPGTLHYSAPEALSHHGQYSAKIDIFSFGHLLLFTVTQIYPEVASATYNVGSRLVARTEIQRRQDAIDAMELQLGGPSHPLLQLTLRCLQNTPSARPTADILCQELEQMREVIADMQENLGRLQLIDMVAEREGEVQRQETYIAQLRSQLELLKSTSGGGPRPLQGGASLHPAAAERFPRSPPPRAPRPQPRSQYAPMALCNIPLLDCNNEERCHEPFLSRHQLSRSSHTPPPPTNQRLHPLTHPSGSLTPPPPARNRNTYPNSTSSVEPLGSIPPHRSSQPAMPIRPPVLTHRDCYPGYNRPPIPLPTSTQQREQVRLVSQPRCHVGVHCRQPGGEHRALQQFQLPTRTPSVFQPLERYGTPILCQPPILEDHCPYLQPPPVQRIAQNAAPVQHQPHPAYGLEENSSAAARFPGHTYGRCEAPVRANQIPHPASVPSAMASLRSADTSDLSSSGNSSRSSQRSQSVDFSMFKAGHMAKNMDFVTILRELDTYAERMRQCALETVDDEYIAMLFRPLCLEAPNTAWKVVFVVFKKGIRCGHPFAVFLASILGEFWPTTIPFKFGDRSSVTLQIPNNQAEQQGFQVQMDSEVGPCMITKEEADAVMHDFVTYPPRRVLRVRPIVLPPVCELDLTLELQGVAVDEDHPARHFRLTSPELSPSCDLSTAHHTFPEMGRPQQQATFGITNQSQPAGQSSVDGTDDDPNGVLDSEPSVADFMNKIGTQMFEKWEELGHELRLDRRIIEGVRMNTRNASMAEASIREVFLAWHRSVLTDERRSWATVLRALQSRQVDELRLARQVRRQLLAPPTAADLV